MITVASARPVNAENRMEVIFERIDSSFVMVFPWGV